MSIILDIYGNKIMLPENIDLPVSHYYVIQISRKTIQKKTLRSKGRPIKPMLTAGVLFNEEERLTETLKNSTSR